MNFKLLISLIPFFTSVLAHGGPHGGPYCNGCEVTYTGKDEALWGWENNTSCEINLDKCSTVDIASIENDLKTEIVTAKDTTKEQSTILLDNENDNDMNDISINNKEETEVEDEVREEEEEEENNANDEPDNVETLIIGKNENYGNLDIEETENVKPSIFDNIKLSVKPEEEEEDIAEEINIGSIGNEYNTENENNDGEETIIDNGYTNNNYEKVEETNISNEYEYDPYSEYNEYNNQNNYQNNSQNIQNTYQEVSNNSQNNYQTNQAIQNSYQVEVAIFKPII